MEDTNYWSKLQEQDEDYTPEDDEEPAPQEPEPETAARPANISQHTLLSYLVGNFDVWTLAEPIIKPDYFDEEYKTVVSYLVEHCAEYKQIPSPAIVRMKTGVLLDRYEDAEDPRTTQWLLDEIQTFCRHRATTLEIRRAGLAIQQDTSRATLEGIYQNLKTITEISLEKDLGVEVHRDARMILSMKEEEIIKPSGYKHLDHVTGGGLPKPGLVLFAGSSGIGKSVMLTNFGVQYCMQGDFVVYISLELDERRIFQRVSSIMTDVKIGRIYVESEKVASNLEYRMQAGDGIFRIKKMKMSGTTVSHINAYLKELYIKEGRKPDVLILDYLDLLHPRARIRDFGDIHTKDKYTSEETYDLLKEWDLLGLTASQMVKNNSEMDDFDHASVAGGTPKINTSDYVIALRRKEHELWGKIQKGRYGGEGAKIPFEWNIDTLKISDGADEVFYDANARYDPKHKEKLAEKTIMMQKDAVNKDLRQIQNDDILDRIKQKMTGSILDDDEFGEMRG